MVTCDFLCAREYTDLTDTHRLCSPGQAVDPGSCQGSGPSGYWWLSRQTPTSPPLLPRSPESPAETGLTPWRGRKRQSNFTLKVRDEHKSTGVICAITKDRLKPYVKLSDQSAKVMEWREGVAGVKQRERDGARKRVREGGLQMVRPRGTLHFRN